LYVELFDFDMCLVLIWGNVSNCVLSDWVPVINSSKLFEIKNTKGQVSNQSIS